MLLTHFLPLQLFPLSTLYIQVKPLGSEFLRKDDTTRKEHLICETDPPQLPHSRAAELNNSNDINEYKYYIT